MPLDHNVKKNAKTNSNFTTKAQEPNMIMKMIIALSIQRYYISFE